MNNYERKTVALRYGEDDAAPRVLASGTGYLADRIEVLAREHGIPIVKDTFLADILSIIEPGSTIPKEAYKLVAELLAFLYRTDVTFRESHKFMASSSVHDKKSW